MKTFKEIRKGFSEAGKEISERNKAPKIKHKEDPLKTTRKVDAAHAKAMGRSAKTGKKLPTKKEKPVSRMMGDELRAKFGKIKK